MTAPRFQIALLDSKESTPPGLVAMGGGLSSLTTLQTFYRASDNFPEETLYPLCISPHQVSTGTPAINRLQFIPFSLPVRVVIDRLAFEVTTISAGGVARMGLYNADQRTLRPTTLIRDSGEHTTTGAGIHFTVINNLELQPGVIYCAAHVQGTNAAGCRALTNIGAVFAGAQLGYLNSAGAFFQRHGWEINPFAYGALPLDMTGQTIVTLEAGEVPVLTFARFASVAIAP